jgi:lipopolysaccharide biosynthesis glycosyltransferase
MRAVTSGLFDDYQSLAQEAARRFQKHTGLPVVLLDHRDLMKIKDHPLIKHAGENKREQALLLKIFLFDLIPDDDFIWFDADYACIAPWDPLKDYDGSFTAIRDRTAYLLKLNDIKSSSIINYFNSGFFIANRQNHASLFRFCQEEWQNIEWRWHDQCLLNFIFERTGTPVRYLDRRHNCMNYGPVFERSNVLAVHCSSNYEHYRKGVHIHPGTTHIWDSAAMKELAGFYNCEYENDWRSLFLMYDGTTSEGELWFADQNKKIIFTDIYGSDLTQPRWIRRTG